MRYTEGLMRFNERVVSRIITQEDGTLYTQFSKEVGLGRGYFARVNRLPEPWYIPYKKPYVVIFALSPRGTIPVGIATSFCFIPDWWNGKMMNRYVVEGA